MINQKLQDFEEEVKPIGNVVTEATLEVYNTVVQRFLPTPAKIHYLFNLRDISKVKHLHLTLPLFPGTASLQAFCSPQNKPWTSVASHTSQINTSYNAAFSGLTSTVSGRNLFPPFIPLATPLPQVFQGMLRANKDFHDTKSSITRLWIHECFR